MMMKSPWRQQQQQNGAENNRGISHHMVTLHKRLYHALQLGSYGDKGKKVHFADIETERLVVRSIDAFLDSVTSDTSHHPFVKDSIADIVKALENILQLKNEVILSLASNVALKMVDILPSSVLQPHLLDFIRPLTALLPSHQKQVAILCATALKFILSESSIKDGEVWEILKEANAVDYVVNNIQSFSSEAAPIEYFQEMVSLLGKILLRWPPSRFCVWNNAKLMETLRTILVEPVTVKVAILQLYSALALCGNGAQKLLEDEETIVYVIEHCMARSKPVPLQVEGLQMIQCLVMNELGCSKVMQMGGELIAKAIINGINIWRSNSGKISKDQLSLFVEACRLALVTRWAGVHHNYLWKFGIDKVLLHLLLGDFHEKHQSEESLSSEKLIAIARKGLDGDFPSTLRPFIWDILGGLAVHCVEDLNPKLQSNELAINLLITCVCLVFKDSFQLYQNDGSNIFSHGSAARSVLMMIYSPCKYIASQARSLLSVILETSGREYLKYLLSNLNILRNKFEMVDNLQMVLNLMRLACYSGLTNYWKHIIEGNGMFILIACMGLCLRNDVCVKRSNLSPHWHSTPIKRACCWTNTQDWDGEDIPLLFSLWGIAELINHHYCLGNDRDSFAAPVHYIPELISELKSICYDIRSPGPRWYAAYILSFFGYFGFPSKLGKRMEKSLHETDFSDVELILRSGEALNVHGVILMVRCPSLIPPNELPSNEISANDPVKKSIGECEMLQKVPLSAHVDHQVLMKLLEYVYLGYVLETEKGQVKKLKSLAKSCNLRCLIQMLSTKRPRWGSPFPKSDLASALGPAGHRFSDIILEAKGTNQNHWTCSSCSVLTPHVHAHKVMLWSSCDYFQALLRSGMQESRSETIKVPISWEALVKLVNWIYSDELPKPVSGCLWDNMDTDKKLYELHPFVELCWLAEFWLLGVIREHCTQVVISSLDFARELSIQIIQIAANLSLWEVAEAAANFMAPSYHKLRNSGELDELDEGLVDMVRVASVRLSQDGFGSRRS